MLLRGGAPKNMLDDRGVGGEKVRNATSHRVMCRKIRQTRGHRLSRDHANNSVREKIEAGQHTTRLQIGARMMAKNNLLDDRVVIYFTAKFARLAQAMKITGTIGNLTTKQADDLHGTDHGEQNDDNNEDKIRRESVFAHRG